MTKDTYNPYEIMMDKYDKEEMLSDVREAPLADDLLADADTAGRLDFHHPEGAVRRAGTAAYARRSPTASWS